jgi:translation elongation factor EF-Ts
MQTTTPTLPPAELVGRLIAGLVGRAVTVDKVPPPTMDLSEPMTVAAYIRDNGLIGAVVVSDLALTAQLGAALAMVPAGVANEAIELGALPDDLVENHREIVNVAARLFNRPNLPHMKLRDVDVTPTTLPADVNGLLNRFSERLAVEVETEGYGVGKMWLFA